MAPRPRGQGSIGRFADVIVDLGLALFAIVVVTLMWSHPSWATVPYHLLFLSLMLAYGFRLWAVPVTAAVIAVTTAVTGALMVVDYRAGLIEWAELSEIPLMPALLVAMVWHARRRAAAHDALAGMSAVLRTMLDRERTFFRDTSHAIRTPVTIARGHLELAARSAEVQHVRDDIVVAVRQLDRMAVLSNRLLALAQLDAGEVLPARRLDLAAFIEEVGENWAAEPGRTWVVGCASGAAVDADPVWLALAVDALVENAVHFTGDGGRIEIRGVVSASTCAIVVSDDGTGIDPGDVAHVFDRFWHRRPPNGPMGSGLGLAMARATARAWGGDVRAASSPGGGARLELSLPRSTS